MRSVKEIEELSAGLEFQRAENPEQYDMKPAALSDADMAFIIAACEDAMDDADWKKLIDSCVGKTREEMATLAYAATTTPVEA